MVGRVCQLFVYFYFWVTTRYPGPFFFEDSRPLETGLEELAAGNLTKTDITRLLTKKFNNASWSLVTASTARHVWTRPQ